MKKIALGLIFLATIFISPMTAYGQTTPNPAPPSSLVNPATGITTDSLMSSAVNGGAQGASISGHWALLQLFGNVVDDPLNTGSGATSTTSTILGSVFYILNLVLLAVAVIFMSYGVVSSVAATAHEGQLLGKKQSTIWTPIRLISGVAGLAPIFGGWSMAQLFAIWFAMLGVGAGNIGWQAAVEFMSQGGQLTYRVPNAKVTDIGQALFSMQVCRESLVAGLEDWKAVPGAQAAVADYMISNFDGGVSGQNLSSAWNKRVYWGAPAGSATSSTSSGCGIIMDPSFVDGMSATAGAVAPVSKLPGNAQMNALDGAASATSIAIARAAAATAIIARVKLAFDTLSAALAAQAKAVVLASNPNPLATPPAGGYDQVVINTAIMNYDTAVGVAVSEEIKAAGITSASSNAMKAITDRAKSEGFLTAGAYFVTLARAGNSMEDLGTLTPTILAPAPAADPMFFPAYNQRYIASMNYIAAKTPMSNQLSMAVIANGGRNAGGASSGDTMFDKFIQEFKSGLGCKNLGVPLGQCFVDKLIPTDALANKHILLVLKDAGDTIIWTSIIAIPATAIVKDIIEKLEGKGGINIGSAAGIAVAFVASIKSLGSSDVLWAGVYAIVDLLQTAFKLLLPFGLMLSIYLPLIPLIHWIGAVISWLGKVVEGVINSSLWAFAHLDTDGEGMGQRTQHGYIFMLNLLLTPLLMVIGLIMSLVVMKVVGSMFAIVFPMAIADVQGNSWTGVFSIIGFCVIFCTTAVMIITNACDLIHHVPDSALTWIGGSNAQGMGKKMSDNFAQSTGALGAIMNNMGGKITGSKGLTKAREKNTSDKAATTAAETAKTRHKESTGATDALSAAIGKMGGGKGGKTPGGIT